MTKFHKGDIVTIEDPTKGGFGLILEFDCYDGNVDCWVIHKTVGRVPATSSGLVLYESAKHDKLFADPNSADAIKRMAPSNIKYSPNVPPPTFHKFPDVDSVDIKITIGPDAPKAPILPCAEYDFGSGDTVQVKDEKTTSEFEAIRKMVGTVTTGGAAIVRVNFSGNFIDVPVSILRMIDKRSDGLHNYELVKGFRHDEFICKKCGKKRSFEHKKDVA